MPFDGEPPQAPPPDYQAIAQQWAQLHSEECNRSGNQIVALRLELAAVKAQLAGVRLDLAAAAKRIAELEAAARAAPDV